MRIGGHEFRSVWAVDFEFRALDGERPEPICLVAHELLSDARREVWLEGDRPDHPPYDVGHDSIFVAYYASAELGCHLALDWPFPANVLDLFSEFRNHTNGMDPPSGASLLGALLWFGLPSVSANYKKDMRGLILRGGPWSAPERREILDYCAADVRAVGALLKSMNASLDLPRALLRGRYMKGVARMEHAGVPLDAPTLDLLRVQWEPTKRRLIEETDQDFGVYEDGSFRKARFEKYLARRGIAWPRLPSGDIDLKDAVFKDMARTHPAIAPLRELRSTLAKLRLNELRVGRDGRNRTLLSPFRSKTSRNQPSSARFIFGPSTWIRGLIQPPAGHALAYIDWEQQEFGIAAALSGDDRMMAAYDSGDPYLAFAVQAGAAPEGATKQSHPDIRDRFKDCALAVQYGMGAESLALRIDVPVAEARHLLALHRRTYPRFWRWSEAVVDFAMTRGDLYTVFGWTVHVGHNAKPRSFSNFPMQANGAEMLRLACCYATEAGIKVCAPVHDALLIEAPARDIGRAVEQTQKAMAHASAIVLDGFELRTDVQIVHHPQRLLKERGREMWERVIRLAGTPRTCAPPPAHLRAPVPSTVSSPGSSSQKKGPSKD